jgi:lysozyme family protein
MNFDEAFKKVIGLEGGYANHPDDPGGETKYGISKRAYPREDIANLTLDRAKQIYLKDYWGAAGCDSVPDAIKYHLFDMAVNQGVKTSIKALQKSVGEFEDGIIGPLTLQAIQSTPVLRIALRLNAARLKRYTETDNWATFGKGWASRVAELLAES